MFEVKVTFVPDTHMPIAIIAMILAVNEYFICNSPTDKSYGFRFNSRILLITNAKKNINRLMHTL